MSQNKSSGANGAGNNSEANNDKNLTGSVSGSDSAGKNGSEKTAAESTEKSASTGKTGSAKKPSAAKKPKQAAKPPTAKKPAEADNTDKKQLSGTALSNAERKFRKTEKYRQQQREKLLKKVALISVLAVIVIAVASIAIYSGMQAAYGHIMIFDGKKISTEDFKLMYTMYGTKEDALNVLKEELVVSKAANERGMGLTEEERDSAKAQISEFKEYLKSNGLKVPNVTEERFIEILGISTIYTKMADMIEEDITIDEEDFQIQFEDYLINGKKEYIDTQMKYLMAQTEYDAEFAREMFLTGMEADEVIKAYSTSYSEEYGIERISLSMLGVDDATVEELMALEVGEASEVIDFGGTYVFFIIDEIYVPEEAEIEVSYREKYINDMVDNEFYQMLDEWISASAIEVNQKAYDRVN